MIRTYFSFLLAGFALLASLPADAAAPKKLGTFGAWASYELVQGGDKVCYMVSKPVKDEGDYSRRGDIFALVTHRPSEKTRDVFSYITGYTYKPGSDATLTIDGKRYVLFVQNETAWTPDADTDRKVAADIQKGSKMVVRGTSSRGTLTTDTFSLKGSGAAYKAITKACGF